MTSTSSLIINIDCNMKNSAYCPGETEIREILQESFAETSRDFKEIFREVCTASCPLWFDMTLLPNSTDRSFAVNYDFSKNYSVVLQDENLIPWAEPRLGASTRPVRNQLCRSAKNTFRDYGARTSGHRTPMDYAIWSILEEKTRRRRHASVETLKKSLNERETKSAWKPLRRSWRILRSEFKPVSKLVVDLREPSQSIDKIPPRSRSVLSVGVIGSRGISSRSLYKIMLERNRTFSRENCMVKIADGCNTKQDVLVTTLDVRCS
ncbi:hypothetical protein FQA39_LY18803 [Lamprigera yunnana]|nr:hypothetical protein FQA39_LY18803 [Lamprigera yunnana]